MPSILSTTLAVLATFSSLASCHNIQMKAHGRECFHEQLHADDKMTVTFQVGDREFGHSSGNLDIDFWASHPSQVQTPGNTMQVHERGVASGDHSFTATQDGRYTYCFSNEHSSFTSKEVSFNVHGIVYVPESEAPQDPLDKEVRYLSDLLAQVKDEQSYIVVRERTHRNTAESTNSRVKWWSIFQLGVLLGEGIFQVWYLKRFFEVRNIPSFPLRETHVVYSTG
ncbi:MAG: p24 complex component [Bogoriella megaspora]|nr:MAG: p24 complex component [Bogoriella megaspora]